MVWTSGCKVNTVLIWRWKGLVATALKPSLPSILKLKKKDLPFCTLIVFHSLCIMLAHCATSRKVTGSIPDTSSGKFFQRLNPSDHSMALELTQPLTEISTRNISWGVKAASA